MLFNVVTGWYKAIRIYCCSNTTSSCTIVSFALNLSTWNNCINFFPLSQDVQRTQGITGKRQLDPNLFATRRTPCSPSKRKDYANTAFVAKASPFLLVSPFVRRPSWSCLVSLSDCCSARTLCRPAFCLRISARTWFGETNCLFS